MGGGEGGKKGGRGLCSSSLLSSRLLLLPFLPVSAGASLGPWVPRLLVAAGVAPASQPAFGPGPWGPRTRGRDPPAVRGGGTRRQGLVLVTPAHCTFYPFWGPPLASFLQSRLQLAALAGPLGVLSRGWGRGAGRGPLPLPGAGTDLSSLPPWGIARPTIQPHKPTQPWHRGRVLLPKLRPGPAGDLLCHPRQVREGCVCLYDRASGKMAPQLWPSPCEGNPPLSPPAALRGCHLRARGSGRSQLLS